MGEQSTVLPARSAKPGDYRPETTPRLSERMGATRQARDVARDRFRDFRQDNPDATREDFQRYQRLGMRSRPAP